MPRLAKTQTKVSASSNAARLQETKAKEVVDQTLFIDDEAQDSDGDGILVDAADVNAGSDSEGYEPDFIDDRVVDDAAELGTPDLTPVPVSSPTQKIPLGKGKSAVKARSGPVIELESSDSEEDLESMAVDDSMYRKPAGVKAAALPPSLLTRSKRTSDLAPVDVEAPSKKRKSDAPISSSSRPQIVADRRESEESAMERWVSSWQLLFALLIPPCIGRCSRFMTAFMVRYLQSNADAQPVEAASRVPRIDFDQIALDKGIAASRKETKRSQASSSNAGLARLSPDWDASKLDSDFGRGIVVDSKGKGKGRSRDRPSVNDHVSDVFHSAPVDEELVDVVSARDAQQKSQLEGFVVKKRAVVAPVTAGGLAHDDPALTLAQYFKENSTVVALGDQEDTDDALREEAEPPSTVFLEDLENYKAFYDPDAPCGVFDPDLQDPALALTYRKLPPLPAGRQLLAVYDPSRNAGGSSDADIKGGRAKFSSWRRHLKTMLAKNCIGSLPFASASKRPLELRGRSVLLVDGQIAVCLSAIFCTDSVVVNAGKIGARSERYRKWIAGIFHNQDWERFESVVCLVFGEDIMYTQINNKKAVSFLSMISPVDAGTSGKDTEAQFSRIAPVDMFSPVVSTTPTKPRVGGSKGSPVKAKTLLAHNDFLPVFDARKTPIDFSTDLGRLGTVLPAFTGEIPFSSFVVVGYSVSAYSAALSGTTERVPHVGCNVLWAIVCGTPVLKRK
ncbi:hypothetical protein C8F04DRAFT_1255104 [Mycena alexandri]|uniref:Uncharacterized protein n=1 Tax=Mycena alexandri TaxID=1745969 RepID=A0AAD6XBP8_9AGAR|nr:hypothetical protein C8F04DRAFT_1255104 [Mycena alexandri]